MYFPVFIYFLYMYTIYKKLCLFILRPGECTWDVHVTHFRVIEQPNHTTSRADPAK